MTDRTPAPRGQIDLFEVSPEGSVIPWQEIEKRAYSHSVVAERAERLIHVMNTMASRNMLLGLAVGGTDPEHRTDIVERYAEGTPFVLANSKNKAERLHDEAQVLFWHATGFEALRGTGMLGQRHVAARAAKMLRDFSHDFGNPKVHADMVKFRRTQEKFLPMVHPLREENRLAKYKKRKAKAEELTEQAA